MTTRCLFYHHFCVLALVLTDISVVLQDQSSQSNMRNRSICVLEECRVVSKATDNITSDSLPETDSSPSYGDVRLETFFLRFLLVTVSLSCTL